MVTTVARVISTRIDVLIILLTNTHHRYMAPKRVTMFFLFKGEDTGQETTLCKNSRNKIKYTQKQESFPHGKLINSYIIIISTLLARLK